MTGLFPACKQESQLSPDSIKSEEEANKMLSDSFGVSHLPQDARISPICPGMPGFLLELLLTLVTSLNLCYLSTTIPSSTVWSPLHTQLRVLFCFFLFQLKVKSRNYCFFQTAQGYQTTVGSSRSQKAQEPQITGHSDPGKKMQVIVCGHFSKKFRGTQSPLKTQFRKSVLDHVKNIGNYK